jgi:DNA end-binding protein Ku
MDHSSLNELLPEYIEKPYFVVPEKGSVEAFTVIRKALQNTGMVATGKVSFVGRENAIAIRAAGVGGERRNDGIHVALRE